MKKLIFLLLFFIQFAKPYVFIANVIAPAALRKMLKLPLYSHGKNKVPRCSFELPSTGEHEGYFHDFLNEDGTFSACGFLSPYKDEILGENYRFKVGNILIFLYLDADDTLCYVMEDTRGSFPAPSEKEEVVPALIRYIEESRPCYICKSLGVFAADKHYWIDLEIKKEGCAIDLDWGLHPPMSKAK